MKKSNNIDTGTTKSNRSVTQMNNRATTPKDASTQSSTTTQKTNTNLSNTEAPPSKHRHRHPNRNTYSSRHSSHSKKDRRLQQCTSPHPESNNNNNVDKDHNHHTSRKHHRRTHHHSPSSSSSSTVSHKPHSRTHRSDQQPQKRRRRRRRSPSSSSSSSSPNSTPLSSVSHSPYHRRRKRRTTRRGDEHRTNRRRIRKRCQSRRRRRREENDRSSNDVGGSSRRRVYGVVSDDASSEDGVRRGYRRHGQVRDDEGVDAVGSGMPVVANVEEGGGLPSVGRGDGASSNTQHKESSSIPVGGDVDTPVANPENEKDNDENLLIAGTRRVRGFRITERHTRHSRSNTRSPKRRKHTHSRSSPSHRNHDDNSTNDHHSFRSNNHHHHRKRQQRRRYRSHSSHQPQSSRRKHRSSYSSERRSKRRWYQSSDSNRSSDPSVHNSCRRRHNGRHRTRRRRRSNSNDTTKRRRRERSRSRDRIRNHSRSYSTRTDPKRRRSGDTNRNSRYPNRSSQPEPLSSRSSTRGATSTTTTSQTTKRQTKSNRPPSSYNKPSRSSSRHDDSYGHFEGGPGTMIANRYRLLRDVGMGTFGRVVEALDIWRRRRDSRRRHHRRYDDRMGRGGNSGSSGGGSEYRSEYDNERVRGKRRRMGRTVDSSSSSSSFPRGSRYRRRRAYDGGESKEDERPYQETVAIKIVRNVERYYDSALIEADVLRDVNRRGGRGRSLCAVLLDDFDVSPGHYCLVFERLGRSLYDFMKDNDYAPFPSYCVRDFAGQLLDALDFMHGFGLIHTDLKPENVLLVDDREKTYVEGRGDGGCGGGGGGGGVSGNGRLSYTKRQRRRRGRQQIPYSTAIKVIDFGGATYDYEKKSTVVNTRQYRAPEVILELGWSMPSDLWSLGCILAELYAGELLFETHDNAEHLALIEKIVGRFPLSMVAGSRWKMSSASSSVVGAGSNRYRSNNHGDGEGSNTAVFDVNGRHRMGEILPPSSVKHVDTRLDLDSLVSEWDRKSGLGLLLRSLLVMEPRMRKTAGEALKLPYFF